MIDLLIHEPCNYFRSRPGGIGHRDLSILLLTSL